MAKTIQQQDFKNANTLQEVITNTVSKFLDDCIEMPPRNLYDLFLELTEEPLFRLLMEKTNGNQCEITRLTGLSRGTVRKKLKSYGFIPAKIKTVGRDAYRDR